MRVMLMALPTRTHIYGLAAVGWALRTAGHEVRYVCQCNPAEVDSFAETGLDSMWFGEDMDVSRYRRAVSHLGGVGMDAEHKISESRPEKYTDDYVRSVYATWAAIHHDGAADSFLDDVLPFARYWKPDLVIWDPIIYAAPLIAHAVGATNVRMLIALDQTARITAQYQEMMRRLDPAGLVEDPLVAWMSQWLDRHGCAFDERLRFGVATLDPQPSCMRFDLDVNYMPVRFAPFNKPTAVPQWMVQRPDRPRICLTLGVSGRQLYTAEETSVADLLDGLADLDVEVVANFSADQLADVPKIPDNVRVADFVPLAELLSTCCAIIHQGGGATLCNAVVNGVPQLVIPGTKWSERAAALAQRKRGYGLMIDLEDVTPQAIRDGVEQLLYEPSFKECAVEVQQEMLATPSFSDIVTDLELVVAGGTPC
jgi:glycosyltransferase (activator-dependent family)